MFSFNAVDCRILSLPGYFFCAGIGAMIAICLFMVLLTKKRFQVQLCMRALPISIICLCVSARVFGYLSGAFQAIGAGEKVTWSVINNTGIVFYGGLFGLLGSFRAYLTLKKLSLNIMDILAVPIPLFHAIARIGCFLGGCCFGIEYEGPLSVLYSNTVYGHIEIVPRIPVQLFEAVFNVLLFVYLIYLLSSNNWQQKNILRRYMLIYSVGRFAIEYLRGDSSRGITWGISFSQLISVIILICLAFFTIRERKHILI